MKPLDQSTFKLLATRIQQFLKEKGGYLRKGLFGDIQAMKSMIDEQECFSHLSDLFKHHLAISICNVYSMEKVFNDDKLNADSKFEVAIIHGMVLLNVLCSDIDELQSGVTTPNNTTKH